MNPECSSLQPSAAYWTTRLLAPDSANAEILRRFEQLRDDPTLRRTHEFHGRFENIYVDRSRIPELQPVFAIALRCAAKLLHHNSLKFGFWFNEMGPGSLTTLHTHEENDELLSGVYYVTAPDRSGRLILHREDERVTIEPSPGLFVFFAPTLPHEVEINRSDAVRLSVAFNFGPA